MKYKKTRAECAMDASEAQDGTYISGHMGVSTVAFTDEETGRTYYVDICENCGQPSVCWDTTGKEREYYPVSLDIGGAL